MLDGYWGYHLSLDHLVFQNVTFYSNVSFQVFVVVPHHLVVFLWDSAVFGDKIF